MEKFVKSFITIFIICLIMLVGFWVFKHFSEPAEADSDDNVSGWAWSERIGWISFNGSNYGVNLDTGSGKFSGYAWSENIGWVSFNESDLSGCPNPPCRAEVSSSGQIGKSDVDVNGWARAVICATDPVGCGGWDGWIRFDHGGADEVYIDAYGEFYGWAWGSDVVGWISFNCLDRYVCGSSDYKVLADINSSPSVTCDDSETWIYCSDSKAPTLFWNYFDPDGDLQESYWIQIDDGDFSVPEDIEIDTGELLGTSYHPSTTEASNLNWGTTYYWRIKVKDDQGNWSNWSASICSFITPVHAYPDTDFDWSPQNPNALEPVQFTDQTNYYNGGNSWAWTFESAVPASSILQNPVTTFSEPGDWEVILEATDSDGFMCPFTETINVSYPLPDWEEVVPR